MKTKKIERIENDDEDNHAGLYCPECENGDNPALYRLKGDTGGVCGICFMGRHMPLMRVIR